MSGSAETLRSLASAAPAGGSAPSLRRLLSGPGDCAEPGSPFRFHAIAKAQGAPCGTPHGRPQRASEGAPHPCLLSSRTGGSSERNEDQARDVVLVATTRG